MAEEVSGDSVGSELVRRVSEAVLERAMTNERRTHTDGLWMLSHLDVSAVE